MFESILLQILPEVPVFYNPGQFGIIEFLSLLVTYQWFILAGLIASAYFVLVRLFAMPLLTRNPHELVLILSPGGTKIFKVKERLLPFFSTKHASYWYSEPLKIHVKIPVGKQPKVKKVKKQKGKKMTQEEWDKQLTDLNVQEQKQTQEVAQNREVKDLETGSLLHIFVDAVNQPIYDLKRNPNKVMDLTVHRQVRNEVRKHNVLIPPTWSFGKNWMIVINGDKAFIERTNKKQPHKVSFLSRVGIYKVDEVKVGESSTSASTTTLKTVTVQTIIEEVGGLLHNSNYSASFSRKLIRDIRNYERNWVMILLGLFDWRIIMVLLVAVVIIAAVFLLYKPGDLSGLGPQPGT